MEGNAQLAENESWMQTIDPPLPYMRDTFNLYEVKVKGDTFHFLMYVEAYLIWLQSSATEALCTLLLEVDGSLDGVQKKLHIDLVCALVHNS